MAFFYRAPSWFLGWDIGLELLFGIITAIVAYFSLKIYNLCEERECRTLGIAFSSISISYFIWSLVNLFALLQLEQGVTLFELRNISTIMIAAVYAHVVFFILGLSALVYMGFSERNHRLYTLLASISIVVVFLGAKLGLAFNFISALLLLYIVIDYSDRVKRHKNNQTWLVLVAFTFLFAARASFVFSIVNPAVYVLDHFMELIGYLLIAIRIIKIRSSRGKINGQKKK